MEYREVIVEDYDCNARILVVPPSETSTYLSEVKLNPDGGGIKRRDYESFVVTKLVENYADLTTELISKGLGHHTPYFLRNLAMAVYRVNEGFEPTQVLVCGEKCISRHDAVSDSSTSEASSEALTEVLDWLDQNPDSAPDPALLERYAERLMAENDDSDQNSTNERPPEVLTEVGDWLDYKPNHALITAWSERYLERLKGENADNIDRYEVTRIDEYGIELPVFKETDQFNSMWVFVNEHNGVMENAKLDFSGWMHLVVRRHIWRPDEVESMLFEAEFSKQNAFAIRLKLYEAITRLRPYLEWKRLDWNRPMLQLIRGTTPGTIRDHASIVTGETPDTERRSFAMDPVLVQDLEVKLNEKIKGQPHAIKVLVKEIRRAAVGFGREKQKPIGGFLFAGPTGVGKTETAKALAEILMEGNLITVNCTEYQEAHEISKLFGSPPGYVGFEGHRESDDTAATTLVSRIKKSPSSVVLFDEIEKAHEQLYHALLRVLDEGIMTSGRGEDVSFKDAVVIMTSNIGVKKAWTLYQLKGVGFVEGEQERNYKKLQAMVVGKAIEDGFSPEFRNRLSAVIIFDPIDGETSKEIVVGFLGETADQLKKLHNISLKWTPEVVDTVVAHGFSEEFGCRNLERTVQHLIEHPVSDLIIESRGSNEVQSGPYLGPGETLRGAILETIVEEGKISFRVGKR